MINTEMYPDADVRGSLIDLIHKIATDIIRGVAIPILCDALYNRESTVDGITMDSVQVKQLYVSENPEVRRTPPVQAVYVQEVKIEAKKFLKVVNERISDQLTARVCKVWDNVKDIHHSVECDGEFVTVRGELPVGTTVLSMSYIDKLSAFTMIQPADVEWDNENQ